MSDAVTKCGTVIPRTPEGGNASPTGKPYEWQLLQAENPEIRALPLETLAGRAFDRAEAFRSVLERTAALLVVLSRNNGYEGRDPLIVTDDMSSGTVSTLLGIELDTLARALLEMQRRGMVAPGHDGALRLTDLDAIDRLSASPA